MRSIFDIAVIHSFENIDKQIEFYKNEVLQQNVIQIRTSKEDFTNPTQVKELDHQLKDNAPYLVRLIPSSTWYLASKNSSNNITFRELNASNTENPDYILTIFLKLIYSDSMSSYNKLLLRALLADCADNQTLKKLIFFIAIADNNEAVLRKIESVFSYLSKNEKDNIINYSIYKKNSDALTFLLDHIKNINSDTLNNLLFKAIETSTPEIISALLNHNPNINAVNYEGMTPLMLAVMRGEYNIVAQIIALSPELWSQSPDGKNILHLAVTKDPSTLKCIVGHPNYQRSLLGQKDNTGNTPMDILRKNNTTNSKMHFNKKMILLFSGTGMLPDESFDVSQNSVNKKILLYLKMNNRDTNFHCEGGLCNGYSFLHNLYTKMGKEDYYFSSLVLMSHWNGTLEELKAPLPSSLPQSKFYSNLGELFEQWINDIYIIFSADEIEGIIHNIEQSSRHLQYGLIKPANQQNEEKVISIYKHKESKFELCHINYMGNNYSYLDEGKNLAISKMKHATPYMVMFCKDKSFTVHTYNHKGDVVDIDINAIDNVDENNYELKYIRKNLNYFDTIGIYKWKRNLEEHVNQIRMLEFLKYFYRFPEGVYFDIGKNKHSTTFRKTNSGKIDFYNCNNEYDISTQNNYAELNKTIIEQNGNLNQDDIPSEKKDQYKSIMSRVDEINSFRSHAYHFNDETTQTHLKSFKIFTESELPKNKKEAQLFQEESPNKFTHIHIAVIGQDLITLKRLLTDNFANPNSQDCYRRTPLNIAITNGFTDGCVALLEHSPNQHLKINPFCVGQALANGHTETVVSLLQQEKANIDIEKLALTAMQTNSVEIVKYLLNHKLSDGRQLIHGALLGNQLSLIELLIEHGVSTDQADEMGNTPMHYAIYMLNYTATRYLLNHCQVDLSKKNNKEKTPIDILFSQATRVENTKNRKPILRELLKYSLTKSDTDLFSSVLKHIDNKSSIINKYFNQNGVKITLLHIAIIEKKTDFVDLLLKAGANSKIPIMSDTPRLATNPLVGKTAEDLIKDTNEHDNKYSSIMKKN